jgi:hypothetical protein
MVRALTTLVGLAAAAAILYFVTDVGDSGGSLWTRALLWAAAGLVLGIFYQAGGRRSPGFRANTPMLVLAFLPWTVLSAALVAVAADNPSWLSDRTRDFLPDSWIARWEVSLPAFAIVSGILLAFSLIEPRVGLAAPSPANAASAEISPWTPPEPRPHVDDEPPAVVEGRPTAVIDAPPTVVEEPPAVADENAVPVRRTEGATAAGYPPAEPQREVEPDA